VVEKHGAAIEDCSDSFAFGELVGMQMERRSHFTINNGHVHALEWWKNSALE
jgi:hypothetical protein